MLDQMQEMFENMRSAQDGQESPAERDMRKQIGELGETAFTTSRLCATTPSGKIEDRGARRRH